MAGRSLHAAFARTRPGPGEGPRAPRADGAFRNRVTGHQKRIVTLTAA